MKILEFTNYYEQAKAITVKDSKKDFYEPFEQADGSAEMREFSKIWTVGSAITTAGLYALGYNFSWHTLIFPCVSGLLWKAFAIQHDYNAETAKKILLNYTQVPSKTECDSQEIAIGL